MEKYFTILTSMPLFSGVEPEELSALLGCMQARVVTFPKASPVFLEGDDAGSIGVVLEGAVQIVQDDFYGNRNVISYVAPGHLFGETYACADTEKMPVSGYAVRDTEILWLSCRKMLTVCSNACRFHNQIVKNLLQVVARKNMELSQKIRFMSGKTTRDKLMAYLSAQAKAAGTHTFTIPFDRQALADYLGVERSAMSAELSKLRNDGILTTKGSQFTLLKE